ncbi:alpha-D-ribose 1-methylphosphonate 5-triphosphate synthase subunit PhnG [Alteromonadaceae bacterium 2753L.S.0a.02]|nr:alpha-D-ribose 1-methylphosphonate 5-triphosphate synthase subunit PhnG [Alteromonadaceae bacterium 2753L.S.0a.02]
MIDIPREQWQAALVSLPKQHIADFVASLPDRWQSTPLVVPQAGLAMLKMCESVRNENFNLGEFPLVHVSLRLTTDDGYSAEGAALLMDDDLQHAQHLALCDAILAAQLQGWKKVADLVCAGVENLAAIAKERKTYLSQTKVDFSRLEDAGDYSA